MVACEQCGLLETDMGETGYQCVECDEVMCRDCMLGHEHERSTLVFKGVPLSAAGEEVLW